MGGRSCFITSGAFGDTLLCIQENLYQSGGGGAVSFTRPEAFLVRGEGGEW